MNWDITLVYLNFFGLSALMILAPFYPAWREWRYPSDRKATPIQSRWATRAAHNDSGTSVPPLTNVEATFTPPHRLPPDAVTSGTVQSPSAIIAPSGACFETLVAPTVFWGEPPPPADDKFTHVDAIRVLITRLPHASRWGHNGWRVEGDCHIKAAHHLRGALVVTGRLHIDEDCLLEGDIKAREGLYIGARTHVLGALFCDKDIHLATQVHVLGPVMAENAMVVDSGVRVGSVQAPTTLSARVLTVRAGAVAHGTVHAKSAGVVL
jgi:cytoskeletal protein CcmA (bactofilin family)